MRRFSFGAPMLSNKQRSMPVACSEKIAKLTPFPTQVAPRGYGFPGQVFTIVINATFLIDRSRNAQSAKSESSRGLAEFVMKENREQAQTDSTCNQERPRRRIGQGEGPTERL